MNPMMDASLSFHYVAIFVLSRHFSLISHPRFVQVQQHRRCRRRWSESPSDGDPVDPASLQPHWKAIGYADRSDIVMITATPATPSAFWCRNCVIANRIRLVATEGHQGAPGGARGRQGAPGGTRDVGTGLQKSDTSSSDPSVPRWTCIGSFIWALGGVSKPGWSRPGWRRMSRQEPSGRRIHRVTSS